MTVEENMFFEVEGREIRLVGLKGRMMYNEGPWITWLGSNEVRG
jgi:hypothetical protein